MDLDKLWAWQGGQSRAGRRTEVQPTAGGPVIAVWVPQALEGAAPWLSWDDLDLKHALLWSDLRGLVPAQGIWLLVGPLGS